MVAYTLVLNDTKTVNGIKLTRIQRLADGVLGGYVQSEKNLSKDGNCWLADKSLAYENAIITGDAQANGTFYGSASIRDNAIANGIFYGSAQVYGNALVNGNMRDNTSVFDQAKLFGNASGNAIIKGTAVVFRDVGGNTVFDSGIHTA